MSKIRRRTLVLMWVLAALGAMVGAAPALANNVPNEANWHIHDGSATGTGTHHKGLVFFPALFSDAGLGTYGTEASGGYVICPNATDKGLLPNGANGRVHAAGICMNELYVIQIRLGTDAPAGWSSLSFGGSVWYYRVTGR